ncbi:Protein of unknown function, partial [Gryllus bimaculatus]
GGDE